MNKIAKKNDYKIGNELTSERSFRKQYIKSANVKIREIAVLIGDSNHVRLAVRKALRELRYDDAKIGIETLIETSGVPEGVQELVALLSA